MSEHHEAVLDLAKVSIVGTTGLFASVTIAQVSAAVSLAVGLVTFTYVCAKLYFLIKHKGKFSE